MRQRSIAEAQPPQPGSGATPTAAAAARAPAEAGRTSAAPLFPLFLSLQGRTVLVVGGGEIGWEKAERVAECGARVVLVDPRAETGRDTRTHHPKIRLVPREFVETDLDGVTLAIAATADPQAQRAVARAARTRGILCNVVDSPGQCDFYFGAVLRRGNLQIAVSSGGEFPLLAQRVRDASARAWPPEMADILALLGQARTRLRRRGGTLAENREMLRTLVSPEALVEMQAGDVDAIQRRVEQWTSSSSL